MTTDRARIEEGDLSNETKRVGSPYSTPESDALLDSERMRAEVERIAQVGSWEWTIATNRITWSAELFRMFGLEPNGFDPTYEAYVARLHPDDRERITANVRHALETGDGFSHTHRTVSSDGTERTVLGRGEVIRDASGRALRMIGTAQDVTDRIAFEREIAARQAAETARDRAEFLLNASELFAAITLDFDSTLHKLAALAVPRIADWCAIDVRGADDLPRRVVSLHTIPSLPSIERTVGELMPGIGESSALGTVDGYTYVVAPLRGRFGAIGSFTLANYSPRAALREDDRRMMEDLGRRAGMAIENSRLYQAVLDGREKVERQAAELEEQTLHAQAALADAERHRAAAEAANSAKADFLAIMSHELRTPINAALGYAELLSMGVRGAVTPAQAEDLGRIQKSQRALLSLVNDILNYARLEAGSVEYHITEVVVSEVFARMEVMLAPQLRAKALRYTQSCPEDLVVQADAEKLQQVLLNLLTNAMKFTAEGGEIELSCSPGVAMVELRVRDTGRGIQASQLGRIFEPFVQVDRHLSAVSQQGVGLGLAISRDLLRGMNGDIRVVSEADVGSTFIARLPRAGTRRHA